MQVPGHPTEGAAFAGGHVSAAGGFGTPAAPMAAEYQPASGAPVVSAAPTAKRRRGRAVALVLALAVLVGGGGAVAAHYADVWRAGNGSATDGADGADGAGTESADTVPEGWERVEDPEGFSLALPKGWKRQVAGTQIDYTPDNA